jgi:hypothetical protein
MEIAVLENMNLYGLENNRILEDDKIELLIDLLLDKKTTMRMFIDFIGDHIRDIFVIYSLHRVYLGLRERISCQHILGKLSELFLNFEVCGNTGSSENIFLLNLFCDIHRENYRSPLTPHVRGCPPVPQHSKSELKIK